jgi:hypothetical protein
MHVVNSTNIGFDVLVEGLGFGVVLVAVNARVTSVHEAVNLTDTLVKNNLYEREPSVEHHSIYDNVSASLEPASVEVSESSMGQAKGKGLLNHVCVDEQEEEGCIKELGQESEQGNSSQLLGLSLVVNPGDQGDDDGSNDPIDTCNQVTERAVNEVSRCCSLLIDFANWFFGECRVISIRKREIGVKRNSI